MVEWWQALLISVASSTTVGAVGLLTAYFVHRWTRDGTIEAEVREAIREQRKKEVEPVLRFLDTASRADAIRTATASIRRLLDDDVLGTQQFGPREKVEALLLRDVDKPPSLAFMTSEMYIAFAAAPDANWLMPLLTVWAWVGKEESGSSKKLRSAIQTVRRSVRDYIAEGRPALGGAEGAEAKPAQPAAN